MVAPWDVDQLPETWLDAFRALADQGQHYAEAQAKIQNIKSAWLSRHPTYGKN